MTPVRSVVVAVPARDEAQRIARALAAIERAAAVVRSRADVVVVVAADACTDGTAEVAAAAGAIVVRTTAGRVGAARRAAVAAGLAARPDAVWIACTDADSAVPPAWLATHLDAELACADVLLGTVVPDPHELHPELLGRWRTAHPAVEQHRRVHGANLGVRAVLYARLGGFADLDTDEDVDLVRRARATDAVVRSTASSAVVTSGRRTGRAPGGFSGHLRALEAAGAEGDRD